MGKHATISCALAAAASLWLAGAAAAETELHVGIERFEWVESAPGGARLLEESGPRYALGASWTQDVSEGYGFGLRSGAFFGSVGYEGQTFGGTPVSTDTVYLGGSLEVRAFYRLPRDGWRADLFAALGYRLWARDLESTQAALGYVELWRVPYTGLGISAESGSGLYGEAMAGAPFSARNKAYLSDAGFDGDVTLKPEGRLMLSLEAGYRRGNLALAAFYRRVEFDASDPETASFGGAPVQVFQPESREEVYGLRVGYRF